MTPRGRTRWDFGRHLRSLAGWRRAERDVREEMRLHVELRARELEACGCAPEEAAAQARREVGAPDRVARDVVRIAAATDRASAWRQRLDEAWQDVRYALRASRRAPGFTLIIVLTIALGLGANAAIFGVVNVAVFTPLPFDPDNTLVRVREFRVAPNGTRLNVDAGRRTADAVAVRPDLFTGTVILSGSGRALAQDHGALRVAVTRVGPGFTAVVGVTPVIGRPFTAEEERAGEAGGALLISHRLWQTLYAGDRAVLGRTVHLDARPFVIVGVLPVNFHVPYESDVWFPSHFEPQERSLFILARLAPGMSLERAQSALETLGRRLNDEFPNEARGLGVTAVQARDYFVADEDRIALALMGAVALLLLIGCSNVALLLTTKFAARQGEVAMRAALGCSRARQVRQFVTEGLLLFTVGGAAGLVLAAWLRDALVVFLPEAIAAEVGLEGIPLDWRMVLFATGLSAISGIGFGLIAALRTTRGGLTTILKSGGRSVAGASSRGTLGGFVVVEIALALVLLTTAGVMIHTVRRLQSRDLGFQPDSVATLQIDLNSPRYASGEARTQLLERVLGAIRTVPGVGAAGVTSVNPLCCGNWGMRVTYEGMPPATPEQTPIVQHFIVTPGYFETMRQPVIEGRDFSDQDRPGAPRALIIDRAMAERFWPGERAIGKRVRRGLHDPTNPWLTVVGIVESALEDGEYTESWYLPQAQHATGPSAERAHLMIRSVGDLDAIAATARRIVAEIDPNLAVHGTTTLDALRADTLRQDRIGALVAALFAGAGLLLAALGLYGVLSFAVTADRREIGVRLALGASRIDVLRLIVGRGVRLAGSGLVVGVAASWAAVRLLASVVEEAQFAPPVLLIAAAVLAATAMLAMLVPARRAVALDPLQVLRAD